MRMFSLLLMFALPMLQQSKDTFTRFAYCRDSLSGVYEKLCVDLKPDGSGQSRFKRRGGDEATSPLALSPRGREKFLSIIAATKNLQDREKYESKRRVANLGRKHITLELPGETRTAEFNYSDIKEVDAMARFFDGLINQITLIQELESAARYERLSVPEKLDHLEGEIKVGRLGDPHGMVPALDKLIQDDRILQYARQHAQELKNQILTSK